ncbi:MAG: hypothetical protein JSU03_01930 [Bacteroidetes bacterium]|nr:hypothetical protein [Bacteroidota bacterium]MBS1756016.1 hypothetical protein [Bacteroidota bacterium]
MADNNKTYTVADFAAYHSGKMPEAEMYLLEKAALEDPFLADALEGYAFTTDAEKDVKDIKERLKDKQKSKAVFFISSSYKGWWRAAAAIIIVSGAAILFYTFNHTTKDTNLASTATNKTLPLQDSNANTAVAKNENEPVENKTAAQSNDLNTSKNNTDKSAAPVAASEMPENEQKAALHFDKKENVLTDKIAAKEVAPTVAAGITVKNNNSRAIADTVGSVSQNTDESIVAASPKGYREKDIILSTKKSADIKKSEDNAALSEVVVSAAGVDKSKRASKINMNTKAIPVGAKDVFDTYIAQSVQNFKDTSTIQHSGMVLLSFDLLKNGKPENITIVSSSCIPCNAAAISILKNSPARPGKKGKGILYSMSF